MLEFYYMGIAVNKNMVWGSMRGHKTKIKDMEDSYLINLYHYLTQIGKVLNYQHKALDEFSLQIVAEVLEERGIDMADYPTPLPYEVNGEWFYNGLPATESQVIAYKLRLPVPDAKQVTFNIISS